MLQVANGWTWLLCPGICCVVSAATYVFEGRRVETPVAVRDASSASAAFVVPSAVAERMLPPDLRPAEVAPGRSLFSIAAVEYRDNDLGDYNEVSLAFFVRLRSERRAGWIKNVLGFFAGSLPTYIHRLPVNQTFTCAAGRGIWGFPKTVERIEIDRSDDRFRCTLTCDGREVLSFGVRRGGGTKLRDKRMLTYTRIDDVTHVTQFTSGAHGVGVHLRGAELELGDHPIADELRALGLPKHALLSVWMEHMHGRFDAPVPV